MLMTVIMNDVEQSYTEVENDIATRDRLHKQVNDKLFYADDTIIMAKTAGAVEMMLQKIEVESNKYSLRLNKTKCVHIQMKAIDRVHFNDGEAVPIHTQTDYLGGKIKNTADHKPEIQNRITATWATLRKLDLLWGNSNASIKWKIRVYDAVIVAKVLYGLESIPLTKADGRKLDAFQMKGLRKILKIKNPYWSRVSNEKLLEMTNDKLKLENEDKPLRRLSERIIDRQITLYAHVIRANEDDPMQKISIDVTGERIKADFRRPGHPRIKWYDTTRKHIINKLKMEGILPQDEDRLLNRQEINSIIVNCAIERYI